MERYNLENIDDTISKAKNEQTTTLYNLGQLLHILHSGFFKQRPHRDIIAKAKQMENVLNLVPQLLSLLEVLTKLNKGKILGRVWRNGVVTKEFIPSELPDIGCLYNEYMDILRKKHFANDSKVDDSAKDSKEDSKQDPLSTST